MVCLVSEILQDKIAAAEENNDPALPGLKAELADLTRQRDTLFKGETLRGLLLTTYGFWQFGQEAQLATYVSFGGAGILSVLVGLGVVHAMHTRRIETR